MKFSLLLFTIFALALGGWWIANEHPGIISKVETFINKSDLHTLEIRFSATQIMDAHRKDLLKDNRYQYLGPSLAFYPYLLMEVKYSSSEKRTTEALVLWDLMDGEMVLDTKNWSKSHGFGDCLRAQASKQEFKIINLLSHRGGFADREYLSKSLRIENNVLDSWIDSCRRKQLIVQSGNHYRLHMQKPIMDTLPQTRVDKKLVTQPMTNALRVHPHFSIGSVERMTKAIFGDDFTIRKITRVYLPVHSIVVQNPDGSIHTSHWNALNGHQLSQEAVLE